MDAQNRRARPLGSFGARQVQLQVLTIRVRILDVPFKEDIVGHRNVAGDHVY
jgi:hypothetical protein